MVVNPRRREACTTELTRDFWIWGGEKIRQGRKEGRGGDHSEGGGTGERNPFLWLLYSRANPALQHVAEDVGGSGLSL